jgi:hypothetical protein
MYGKFSDQRSEIRATVDRQTSAVGQTDMSVKWHLMSKLVNLSFTRIAIGLSAVCQ